MHASCQLKAELTMESKSGKQPFPHWQSDAPADASIMPPLKVLRKLRLRPLTSPVAYLLVDDFELQASYFAGPGWFMLCKVVCMAQIWRPTFLKVQTIASLKPRVCWKVKCSPRKYAPSIGVTSMELCGVAERQ
jgi:hypothetical protein